MKKRNYLASVAVLAAAMVLDAGATLPQSLTEQPTVNIGHYVPATEITKTGIPFVLERPVLTGAHAQHSYHSSHRSHSSHSSHHSSRY